LMPLGFPPALPTRRRLPSGRISAQALASSGAQTRPSRLTTTSSGRLRPTPRFVSAVRGIFVRGMSPALVNLAARHGALQLQISLARERALRLAEHLARAGGAVGEHVHHHGG